MVTMRVDTALCQGHGLCQREAPAIFELPDDRDHAVVLVDPIPAVMVAPARRALEGCPEQAIREVTHAEQR